MNDTLGVFTRPIQAVQRSTARVTVAGQICAERRSLVTKQLLRTHSRTWQRHRDTTCVVMQSNGEEHPWNVGVSVSQLQGSVGTCTCEVQRHNMVLHMKTCGWARLPALPKRRRPSPDQQVHRSGLHGQSGESPRQFDARSEEFARPRPMSAGYTWSG